MGFFSGMKGTKAATRSDNIAPGHMILRIDRVRLQKSAQDGVEYVAAEQTVLVQLTADSPAYPDGSKIPLNTPGQKVCHIFKGGDKQKDEMARAAFKAFLMGATGVAEEQIDDNDGAVATGPDNPLGGMFVEVNAVAGQTKVQKKPFTYINYVRPVSAARVVELMDPAVKAKIFPGDELEQRIAAEAAES